MWTSSTPVLLRCYRAGILLFIAVLLHQQSRWFDARRQTAISLRQARKFFPKAHRVQLRDAERGLHYVTDARGETIGCLLTTSPHADEIIGYAGPNDILVALDRSGTLVGLELLRSADTDEHVRKVRGDRRFWQTFVGWKPSEAPFPKVDGVSGATLTSLAMAEGIQQRLAGAAPSLRFPDPLTLEEVRLLQTNAARLVPQRDRWRVLDTSGRMLGFALRTSPQADNVAGYRGPTEVLLTLDPSGKIITGLRLRRSYDTDSYVDQIRRAEKFMQMFVGHSVEELARFEFAKEKIEGISGATMTARAVADGVKQRAVAEMKGASRAPPWRPQPRDCALAATLAGALLMSFTSLRGNRWARLTWQFVLVGYVGLVNHDLLSLALLSGWAAHGLALKAAPALVLLAAAALLVPWSTRRQLYCHQFCPHGAAQQLLGRLRLRDLLSRVQSGKAPAPKDEADNPRHHLLSNMTLPSPNPGSAWTRVAQALEFLPAILLGGALLGLLVGLPLDLTSIEPFDAWAWRTAGAATVAIAGVGLAASLFIPQAYCRFGCPTGALLSFVRSAGSADRWSRRDGCALALAGISLIAVVGVRSWPRVEPMEEPLSLSGRTMGTTWSVKIRDEVAEPTQIEKAIADEFELAESLLSHWRTNTDLAIFNRTLSTNAMAVPWPVLTLARQASEISQATDGAYDITVGPLVKLWGFGPGPRRSEPPTDSEIRATLPAVGWQKLEALDGMLRKSHPALEVDFSSIGVGWGVDQVAQLLERRGYTNFLVEAGGELRAHGRWTIAIENPVRSRSLTNESIGTSGTYRRNFDSSGQRYSHLINPRTGRPITHNTVSVSVLHADCSRADAWAAALNVMGAESGMPLAERLNLAAEFVVEDSARKLEVRQTAAWKARDVTPVRSPK